MVDDEYVKCKPKDATQDESVESKPEYQTFKFYFGLLVAYQISMFALAMTVIFRN